MWFFVCLFDMGRLEDRGFVGREKASFQFGPYLSLGCCYLWREKGIDQIRESHQQSLVFNGMA